MNMSPDLRLAISSQEVPRPYSLNELPVELLLAIADFLSPEDIYCLSICCHRLLKASEGWINRQELNQNSRIAFLRRLERDQPKYFICFYCKALHRCKFRVHVDGAGVSHRMFEYACRYHFLQNSNNICSPFDQMHLIIHHSNIAPLRYRFHFLDLYFAMRYFYHGPQYGVSTDALSSIEVTHHPRQRSDFVESTELLSVEAKICPNPPSLHMRIQDLVRVQDVRALLPAEYLEMRPNPHNTLRICGHIPVSPLIEWITSVCCGIEQFSRFGTRPVRHFSTCGQCNTEFAMAIWRDFHGHVTLEITRWINLGPGLTPDDPRWRVHAWFSPSQPEVLEADHMGSSPRDTFEDLADISLYALRSRNLSLLWNRKYRIAMNPIPGARYAWTLRKKAAASSCYRRPMKPLSLR